MAFEVTNSSRGGRGRGRGFGDRGRGGRGSSRGFRGGDRGGGRGGFRGGERGRGGSFRGNRGFKGGDRNGTNEEAPMLHELAHALQLRVCYKTDIPTDEETSAKFPGFHSRFTKPTDSKAHYLLFKDIESVESAKAKFDKDDTVELVDYVGLKSAKNQPQSLENRQIFLQFSVAKEEEAVKELDSKILSVEFMKEKTRQVGIISSCLVEYSTTEEAQNALKILNANKAEDLKFARASQATKTNNFAKSSIQPNFIVLRDVPKTSTIKEFAPLFPEATALMVFNKTFPGSDFCHVSLRFEDPDRVKEILEDKKEIKILKKKIYIFPAYNCLLAEMPKLGETWTGDLKAAVKSTEKSNLKESPNKKIKLEDDVSGEEKEAEDEEESEEESGDEEETKEGNDENMDSAEEESAEEEEDSDDD